MVRLVAHSPRNRLQRGIQPVEVVRNPVAAHLRIRSVRQAGQVGRVGSLGKLVEGVGRLASRLEGVERHIVVVELELVQPEQQALRHIGLMISWTKISTRGGAYLGKRNRYRILPSQV